MYLNKIHYFAGHEFVYNLFFNRHAIILIVVIFNHLTVSMY